MATSIEARLHAALARRAGLIAQGRTNAVRLFHGAADGIDGLVIEQLASVLVVQVHEDKLRVGDEALRAAMERFGPDLGATAVYLKRFVRDRNHLDEEDARGLASRQPWIGEPCDAELIIHEDGLRFLVRPYDGFSIGLFLEHRENRKRVRDEAAGRRVLNLFSYTCGFSVAAAAGGAREVTSVDLSKKSLEWGRRNFAANQLAVTGHWFFCCDVFDYFRRATRQGRRYESIIVGPPTFSRARRPVRVFVLRDRLDDLLAGAMALLERPGRLLVSTNDRTLSDERLEGALRRAGGAGVTAIARPPPPADFAGDRDYSRTIIANLE